MSTLVVTVLFLLASDGAAQTHRMELGRRLKRFEIEWEVAASARREASVPFLKAAVKDFFSLRLSEAGRQMDYAWLAVQSDVGADPLTTSMIGSQVLASPVCSEVRNSSLSLQLKPFYSTGIEPRPNAIAHLRLTRESGELFAETQFSIAQLTNGTEWKLGQVSEGDHELSVTVRHDDSEFRFPPLRISRISQLERRLKALEDSIVRLKQRSDAPAAQVVDDILAATFRDEVRLMRNVTNGQVQEADVPLLHRLQCCEAMLATRSEPTDFAKQLTGSRQVWMTLTTGPRSVPTRILIPQDVSNPVPVLFVFHGAGGSHNMFFETYGAGRVVREAAKRDWMVIAPRQGLFGLPLDIDEMLDAIASFVPVDRKRVMLMGHSMGASQVVRQVRKYPTLPVAAIALGGGSRMPKDDAKRSHQVSWFVGAGDQDFGLGSAQRLHRDLADAGSLSRFKLYSNVEHLVVVQAAIDDAFQFFDAVLTERQGKP